MDEPLLARFSGHDLPPDEAFPCDPRVHSLFRPCAQARSLSNTFNDMAQRICEACPRSADRTLALRALLDARRHAIDSLLYAETPR